LPFRIPEQHKIGLASILRLSAPQVDTLIAELSSVPSTTKLLEIAGQISPKLPGIEQAELSRIVGTLYSLYQVRASADVSLDRFVTDLVKAIDQEPDLKTSGIPVAEYPERLKTLLGIDHLANHAKAYTLQRDYEHLYHDAQVLTDIRPVFGVDPKERPLGAIITHTIRIVYHEASGKHAEMYLGMDHNDIINLKSVLERAQDKAQTLSTLLDEHGIQNLEF